MIPSGSGSFCNMELMDLLGPEQFSKPWKDHRGSEHAAVACPHFILPASLFQRGRRHKARSATRLHYSGWHTLATLLQLVIILSPAITLPSRPSVRRPRILISPENIQMSERRCRPANENEARRQLRGRRSRNVLGGQQTPDPVTEGPTWSPKTTNRPKFRFFSSSAHIDHCVCSNPTMGRRLGTEGSSPFSQEFTNEVRVQNFVPKCAKRDRMFTDTTRPLSGSSCGKRSACITEPQTNWQMHFLPHETFTRFTPSFMFPLWSGSLQDLAQIWGFSNTWDTALHPNETLL